MLKAMLPSSSASLTPVTVTVCATFQLALVKANDEVLTVPSVVSLLLIEIVTSAVGACDSTTLNCAVPPASVVTNPEVGVTVTIAVAAALSDTAPAAHAPEPAPERDQSIVTEAAPASRLPTPKTVPPPPPVSWVKRAVCPAPVAVKLPSLTLTESITSSPAAEAMVTVGAWPLPVAAVNAPVGAA